MRNDNDCIFSILITWLIMGVACFFSDKGGYERARREIEEENRDKKIDEMARQIREFQKQKQRAG